MGTQNKSRPARWAKAAAKLSKALDTLEAAHGEVENALGLLRKVQEEYEEWRDAQQDRFSGTPTYEKLEAVCELEIDGKADELGGMIDELRGLVDEAEGADLPLGFGKD